MKSCRHKYLYSAKIVDGITVKTKCQNCNKSVPVPERMTLGNKIWRESVRLGSFKRFCRVYNVDATTFSPRHTSIHVLRKIVAQFP